MKNSYEEQGPYIKKGGLYSAFPIPAYQVLGKAKEYQAQKVLLCLVSHLGKGSNCVFPSYTTIAKSCGMSRNSISAGLTVLFEYGFIKIFRFREGKKSRSKYYIQNACWDIVNHGKQLLEKMYSPSGYNIGININEAAGQTIGHAHIHLIPRYEGDVSNPKGGVRGVIPSKKEY